MECKLYLNSAEIIYIYVFIYMYLEDKVCLFYLIILLAGRLVRLQVFLLSIFPDVEPEVAPETKTWK